MVDGRTTAGRSGGAGQSGEGESTARQRDGARLAAAVAGALAGRVPEFLSALDRDPRSEAAWTAVADLALITSILGRDHLEIGRPLIEAMRAALVAVRAVASVLPPGPEQWAAHVAGAWLDPASERARLRDPGVRTVVETSRQEILGLGPAWRLEEVTHVEYKLGAHSGPPPIREVACGLAESSLYELYELTHVAFYATDFGAVRLLGEREEAIGAQLAATAATVAKHFAQGDWRNDNRVYDLGVELVLAAQCLTGRWPEECLAWASEIMPERARQSLAKLEREPGALLGLHHLMGVTALGLARVWATLGAGGAASGTASDAAGDAISDASGDAARDAGEDLGSDTRRGEFP